MNNQQIASLTIANPVIGEQHIIDTYEIQTKSLLPAACA